MNLDQLIRKQIQKILKVLAKSLKEGKRDERENTNLFLCISMN